VETVRAYEAASGHLTGINSTKGLKDIQRLDYRFDVLGNLQERKDRMQNLAETFVYDGINRLTSYTTSTVVAPNEIRGQCIIN
jgi:hypothetical protein